MVAVSTPAVSKTCSPQHGAEAITTPAGAPRANAFAERWAQSVRHELLDRTIIWNDRLLRALLLPATFDEHGGVKLGEHVVAALVLMVGVADASSGASKQRWWSAGAV